MQTSADFRSNHQIVGSYKILRGVTAQADFQMGWGTPLKTPAMDVIDLNGDGQATFQTIEKDGDGYKNGGTILFDEPGFAAPKLSEMERVASAAGKDLLTEEDFAQGLFVENAGVQGKDEATPVHQNLQSAGFLVASHEPWDPEVHFAVDLSQNEFLFYK